MFEKMTRWKILALTALFLMLGAGVVYAATFQQGYNTGCSLGSSETYLQENWYLYQATMDMSFAAGEIDYANGVEGGYLACRYLPPPAPPSPGPNTTCDIWGCESGPHPGGPTG